MSEQVMWVTRCPDCGNRIGSFDDPTGRTCTCAFHSPLIVCKMVPEDQVSKRTKALEADRDRWMSNAHGAQALSLEYLRDRDHYREALEKERARVRMLMARHEKTGELEVSGHAHQLLKIMDKHVTDALNREE